ncbi:MAG: hypothetical protein C4288_12360 [Leptolyngbya sp. ERB_1_1]
MSENNKTYEEQTDKGYRSFKQKFGSECGFNAIAQSSTAMLNCVWISRTLKDSVKLFSDCKLAKFILFGF